MIRIAIDKRTLSIRVRGHAGYAPKGSDILCAGVSALIQTWARCVRLFRASGWLTGSVVEVLNGRAEISASPKPEARPAVEASFLTITEGLLMLQKSAGDYITVEVQD